MTTAEQMAEWIAADENKSLEFKSAKSSFHFEDLVDYCVAIANEGGGKIIFGVTDKRPRSVVGTKAFDEPGRTQAGDWRGGKAARCHCRACAGLDSQIDRARSVR